MATLEEQLSPADLDRMVEDLRVPRAKEVYVNPAGHAFLVCRTENTCVRGIRYVQLDSEEVHQVRFSIPVEDWRALVTLLNLCYLVTGDGEWNLEM